MKQTSFRKTALLLLLLCSSCLMAAEETPTSTLQTDSISAADSVAAPAAPKRTFLQKVGKGFSRFLHNLNDFDSTYIEPQHYIWTVQMQSANTFEKYVAKADNGQRLSFSPETSWRMGPYAGWRFLVLGYTLDMNHLSFGSTKSNRTSFSLSIYSNMFIVDTYWLTSGNDFRISSLNFASDRFNTGKLKDVTAGGINFNMRGLNITYIFNHRKYSYKSVYAQSTQQRRSAGSPIISLGYTRHSMSVDWDKVDGNLQQTLGTSLKQLGLDSLSRFNSMRFADLSLGVGYGYNWVFAKNWVFNTTLTLAFAYNQPNSYDHPSRHLLHFHNFRLKNINMYEMGRFGLIWNKNRWYAGANALVRNYDFKRDRLNIRHTFGSINVYVGYYFGKRHN